MEADVVVSDVVNSSTLRGGKTRRRRVAAADRPQARTGSTEVSDRHGPTP